MRSARPAKPKPDETGRIAIQTPTSSLSTEDAVTCGEPILCLGSPHPTLTATAASVGSLDSGTCHKLQHPHSWIRRPATSRVSERRLPCWNLPLLRQPQLIASKNSSDSRRYVLQSRPAKRRP